MMSEVWRPSNVISFVNHDNITVWWHVIGSQIVQRELHHRVSTTFMRTVKVHGHSPNVTNHVQPQTQSRD